MNNKRHTKHQFSAISSVQKKRCNSTPKTTRIIEESASQPPMILEELPEAIKAVAMAWYERGIRRGLKKATDLMLDDQIFKEAGVLHAPNTFVIAVKTQCGDSEWETKRLMIQAEELGFEQ